MHHHSSHHHPTTMATKKATKGRQRIDMTKIKNKAQLQVTFSKRCAGLFKKANELCTLCGVEIATIVFSPAGKPFSFGHPTVESIVNKFLKTTRPKSSSSEASSCMDLNQELQWLMEQLETEKIKSETLDELREQGRKQLWWEADVDKLGLAELQQLHIALQELKMNVESTQVKLMSTESDPFQLDVNNSWSEGTTSYSPDVSDDGFIPPAVTSFQFPTQSCCELGFYEQW